MLDARGWRQIGRQAAALTGAVRVAEAVRPGRGVILRLSRVRPPRRDRFQPLRADEIAPAALDRALSAFRRWKLDVIALDEVAERIESGRIGRFVCLTFEGAYRDVLLHGHPVLKRHGVPFALYAPTAFPDGLGEAWWLALEAVIAGNSRLSLEMHGKERRLQIGEVAEKDLAFQTLDRWLRSLPPAELSRAINDLCRRYGVDVAALTRDAMMSWREIAQLAADPKATIGAATVNYPVLKHLGVAAATREIAMGRAVLQTALARTPRHFAYPFGYAESFTAAHRQMVKEAGFATAVTTRAELIEAGADCWSLPRLRWRGARAGLLGIRALASGLPL